MLKELLELKELHSNRIESLSERIRNHKYGAYSNDWLKEKKEALAYNKGAWNALNSLERRITKD